MDTRFEDFPSSVNNFRFDLCDDNDDRLFKLNHDHHTIHNQNHNNPPLTESDIITNEPSPTSGSSSEGESSPKDGDFSNGINLKFISNMLMEEQEDLEAQPCMLLDCLALQAAEKSFYDVIGQNYPDTPSSTHSNNNDHVDRSQGSSKGRKSHQREYLGEEEERSSKQSAIYSTDISEPPEIFDQVLLCQNPCQDEEDFESESSSPKEPASKAQRRKARNKKKARGKEVVDLSSLLTQCAQAVASHDRASSAQLLSQIRQHSSQHGDDSQRLAHYFAAGLEARISAGTPLYNSFGCDWASAADILKAYQVYITACPFKRMSNFYANRTIAKLAVQATSIHIIDFGILYGYQWPCLIQRLSERPGGPPRVRITGIEFPQPGFRPSERVEQTARRLENYCRRFGVPFECNVIAEKWENVRYEDLRVERGEVTVVNCLYRMKNLPDETVASEEAECPRDRVLGLIRRIDPDLFIHGVASGTHSAPFFTTRFREAMFHFSALFDMFEASLGREDPHRLMFEREVFGRDVMNVVACEGSHRVERPETYRQWQVRNTRAGFRQVALDRDLVKRVKGMVRRHYHNNFVVDEDASWLLQGWKGRIFHAISCWKSA